MKEIVVIKFGSSLVSNSKGLDKRSINRYAKGLCQTYVKNGVGLVLVTSGAVATGRSRAQNHFGLEVVQELSLRQLATLGATDVFAGWEAALDNFGVLASSIAVTHRQLGGGSLLRRLTDRSEKQTFTRTLLENCESGIVTIINEADAISVVELMELACGGDNDGLASHIARTIGADRLIIFCEDGGVFDNKHSLISLVNTQNISTVTQIAKTREVSKTGRGGLSQKIEACWQAASTGIDAQISAVNTDMTGHTITKFVVG